MPDLISTFQTSYIEYRHAPVVAGVPFQNSLQLTETVDTSEHLPHPHIPPHLKDHLSSAVKKKSKATSSFTMKPGVMFIMPNKTLGGPESP